MFEPLTPDEIEIAAKDIEKRAYKRHKEGEISSWEFKSLLRIVQLGKELAKSRRRGG